MDTRDALHTQLCDLLDIKYPIIQSGMGYLARSDLASEVSNAGGLGVIGFLGLIWLMIYGNLSGNLGFATDTQGYNDTQGVITNITSGFKTFFGFSNTFFTIAAITLLIFMLVGLLGVILPVLPGIPLIFGVALVFSILTDFTYLSGQTIIIMGILAVISLILDWIATLFGVKKMGGSKAIRLT